MKILVTGADGMLGQDLCPILEDCGHEVIETDLPEIDITKPDVILDVLSSEKPDVVIHCAAYTNVDKAEEDIETARLINAIGTKNVAEVCAKLDIPILYISTDYVFDGKSDVPYLPNSPKNPINNYGLTKSEGEDEVRKLCEKYYIVRTSWLYGHHGKNFVETMLSLANKDELKVVNDQTGCPTWTVELSNGITKILEENKPYGIYHVCGSGSTTWYGFAKQIFEFSKLKVNLFPCKTEEFPRPAARPHYSVMNNDKICRDWKLALKDYLDLRIAED